MRDDRLPALRRWLADGVWAAALLALFVAAVVTAWLRRTVWPALQALLRAARGRAADARRLAAAGSRQAIGWAGRAVDTGRRRGAALAEAAAAAAVQARRELGPRLAAQARWAQHVSRRGLAAAGVLARRAGECGAAAAGRGQRLARTGLARAHRWAAQQGEPALRSWLARLSASARRATQAAGEVLRWGRDALEQWRAAVLAQADGGAPVGGRVLAAALTAAVLTLAVVGPGARIGAVGAFSVASPGSLPALEERSVVRARDGSMLAALHGEIDRRVVPLAEVPVPVRRAVITAEDRRFYDHGGYDVRAMVRALGANLRAQKVSQGASTITQQVAQHNFTGSEQTLLRKARELVAALGLEQDLSKHEILQRYLNEVYFGGGAYGIAAAADRYFRTRPSELTVAQGALLAALIRAPETLNPRRNPEAAVALRNAVLRRMAVDDLLSPEQLQQAVQAGLDLAPPPDDAPTDPHVVEAVKAALLSNPAFGSTRAERARLLFTGGLEIHTTIDPRIQENATRTLRSHLGDRGPAGALAAVEPVSGAIRALSSSVDFDTEQLRLATQGRRQPGSALKPFAAAAAMEAGLALSHELSGDSPQRFDLDRLQEPWTVENYGATDFGHVELREAIVRSINTAFADLVLTIGLHRFESMLARAGFDVDAALGPPSQRGPSMVLGGLTRGVTPLEMASAYSLFANEGIRARPHLITRVVGRDGEILHEAEPRAEQVVDPHVAAALREQGLEQVVQRGTGRAAALPDWPVAGKTGTTQHHTDAWFAGTVPTLSAAVWVGHTDRQVPMPGMTGGSLPATMWREFMAEALRGTEPRSFRRLRSAGRAARRRPTCTCSSLARAVHAARSPAICGDPIPMCACAAGRMAAGKAASTDPLPGEPTPRHRRLRRAGWARTDIRE